MNVSSPDAVIPRPARHVWLLGFMASGKSTVGRLLAERISFPFLDLDDMVESRFGLPIMAIFQQMGESAFRQAEFEALQQIAGLPPHVAALGGGTPVFPGALPLILSSGLAVWLDCPIETAIERCRDVRPHASPMMNRSLPSQDPLMPLASSNAFQPHPLRPLAQDERLMRQLYDARLPYYRQAHVRIPTCQRSIAAVIQEILQVLRLRGENSS